MAQHHFKLLEAAKAVGLSVDKLILQLSIVSVKVAVLIIFLFLDQIYCAGGTVPMLHITYSLIWA